MRAGFLRDPGRGDKVLKMRKTELIPEAKYFKTFVPIFPHMYESLEQGKKLGNRKSMQLTGDRMIQGPNSSYGSEPVQVHKKAQIKFNIYKNHLLKYEESREKYLNMQKEVIGPFENDQ